MLTSGSEAPYRMADYILMCSWTDDDFSERPLIDVAIIALSVDQPPAVVYTPQNNKGRYASANPCA